MLGVVSNHHAAGHLPPQPSPTHAAATRTPAHRPHRGQVGFCLAGDAAALAALYEIDGLITGPATAGGAGLDATEYEYARLLEGIAAAGSYSQLRGERGRAGGGEGGRRAAGATGRRRGGRALQLRVGYFGEACSWACLVTRVTCKCHTSRSLPSLALPPACPLPPVGTSMFNTIRLHGKVEPRCPPLAAQ